MNGIRSVALGGLLLLTSVAGPFALAAPVPPTPPGPELIYNFDFTSSSPGPTYTTVDLAFQFSGFGSGDELQIDFFKGLNGTGGAIFIQDLTNGPALFDTGLLNFPDLNDGRFSVGLRMLTGAADITSVTATAKNATGQAATLVQPQSGSVPEPATLALVGLGLAGLSFSRRKQ